MGDFQARKYLDDVVAGTPLAGHAVITDANNALASLNITAPSIGGTAITATGAEINSMCDLSATEQTITSAGAQAITAGKKAVFLNNASTAIASTIANAALHQGYFFIKAGLETGSGQDHTCTITTGTWNGTNKIATFADINDSLFVYFDGSGNGTIITNTGSVSLSG